MDQIQNGVQRQMVIRMFQPDMATLKAVAKQVSEKPGMKLGLYGQGGEALVVLAAQGMAAAAATELSERAAAFIEKKMGDSVYGRGKENSLAHATATVMIEEECTVTCADAQTGALLEAEFKTTKHGDKVFDFGQASYRNARMAAKIADTAMMDDEEIEDPLQQAADRSYAAAKCTRAEFGAAITGTDTPDAEAVFAAVTYRGHVYIRAIRPAPDAGKAAALTVLDIMRRILTGLPVPYARTFKAGREVEWDAPSQARGGKGGKKKSILVPMLALIVLTVVLGVAVWFIYHTFFIKGGEANVPVNGNVTSASQGVISQPLVDDTQSAPASGGTQSTPAGDGTQSAPAGGTTGTGNTTGGVVHPFA